jgi:hypothetical protein
LRAGENVTPIDWSHQHCRVILTPIAAVAQRMPEVHALIAATFPEDPAHVTWRSTCG